MLQAKWIVSLLGIANNSIEAEGDSKTTDVISLTDLLVQRSQALPSEALATISRLPQCRSSQPAQPSRRMPDISGAPLALCQMSSSR